MSSSDARVESGSRWQSLRWRLPLLIGAVSVAVLTLVLYAAYREVEATLLQTGAERARHAADQVSGLFGRSTRQSFDQLRQVAPTLSEYLRDPTDRHLASAQQALVPLAAGPNRHITVWNAAGTRMFDLPMVPVNDDKPDLGSVAPLAAPPELGFGFIRVAGNRFFTDVGVAVPEPGSSKRLGVVAIRSGLSVSPADLLNRLVGVDARILLGNRRGDVWTDLTRAVPGPEVDLPTDGAKEYRTREGDRRLGALSGVPGAPWVVWVDSRAAILSPATRFLQRMIYLGLVMAIATTVLVRWLTIRVTTPLATMTTAAEAMAAGDYSRRVEGGRADEIGRLGRAFNAMTEQVDSARTVLEDRVSERTAQLNAAVSKLHERSRDREAYLATIVESSDDAIIGKDLDGNITSWNSGALKVFGYTAGEMLGTSILRVIPADRQDEEHHMLAILRRSERIDHFVTQRQTKDGRLIDVSVTVSPIPTRAAASSACRKWRATSPGASAPKSTRASEARYRALFDYAPDGIVVADAQPLPGRQSEICRMLGYTREELVGRHASRIVAPGPRFRTSGPPCGRPPSWRTITANGCSGERTARSVPAEVMAT